MKIVKIKEMLDKKHAVTINDGQLIFEEIREGVHYE